MIQDSGDKNLISMFEGALNSGKGGIVKTATEKPGVFARVLQKMPKTGRLGAILGAVGLGAGALFGGSEAKAEEVFQEPGTTELEATRYHDR